MLDCVITGGTVVDGTGVAPRLADVGIRGDRIVAVGSIDEPATRRIDATGLVVAPGFVDPHTHYDAQLFWDGFATPSNQHGVTSVIGGNCGFTLAPLKPRDADYTRRMMARVEGMPLQALENGVDWQWDSFGDYLDRLEGNIGVNAGFLVGHCALRRYVMGPESVERAARANEVDAIATLLHQSLAAGGLGLSTTRSSTHSDGDGNRVPSRVASEDELLTLCRVVGQHEGTTLEAIVEGCLKGFDPAETQLLANMSAYANRPLNWNVLTVDAASAGLIERQLQPSRLARSNGGRVVALTMPVTAEMNMSFGTFCSLWLIPGWREVLTLPLAEKAQALRDPQTRARLFANAQGTPFEHRANFGGYIVGTTVAPQNQPLEGRLVADIARERGVDPFAAIVDIVIADDFTTVLWPLPTSDTDADWAVRRDLWSNEDVLLGGSDAGAHLDRMLGSPYPTRFLADTLRGRKLVSLERAVQLMTDTPARLFGLRDRGRVAAGAFADLVVFDPATVGSDPARRVSDLPGNSLRLTSASTGIEHVLVNGVEAIVQGQSTGALAGTLLRSGRDTDTIATN
ncbi:MAG: amidohydrolase family protein [Acidimicrobiales bacterium]